MVVAEDRRGGRGANERTKDIPRVDFDPRERALGDARVEEDTVANVEAEDPKLFHRRAREPGAIVRVDVVCGREAPADFGTASGGSAPELEGGQNSGDVGIGKTWIAGGFDGA